MSERINPAKRADLPIWVRFTPGEIGGAQRENVYSLCMNRTGGRSGRFSHDCVQILDMDRKEYQMLKVYLTELRGFGTKPKPD